MMLISMTCGKGVPVLTFDASHLPEGKMCLKRRIQDVCWHLRQSPTRRNGALGVRGEAGNCKVGIFVAFETAEDVWEQQEVPQDLWPRPQQ